MWIAKEAQLHQSQSIAAAGEREKQLRERQRAKGNGPSYISIQDDFSITANGFLKLQVGTGKVFEVRDHLGATKIRWTEGTNDLHIPTGGTVIANL